MATKSITKDVVIRKSSLASNLVHALETAQGRKGKKVCIDKKVSDVKGEVLREMFKK